MYKDGKGYVISQAGNLWEFNFFKGTPYYKCKTVKKSSEIKQEEKENWIENGYNGHKCVHEYEIINGVNDYDDYTKAAFHIFGLVKTAEELNFEMYEDMYPDCF